MLALQQASLRLNVVWISYPSYILSSFLGAKIGFIFDTSKEKGRKVHLWGFFCLFVRHWNRYVRQKTANELDMLDKREYTLSITLFLILYVLILHCQQTETELTVLFETASRKTAAPQQSQKRAFALHSVYALFDLLTQRNTGNGNRFPNHILIVWFLFS